jgi:hypothetical protein
MVCYAMLWYAMLCYAMLVLLVLEVRLVEVLGDPRRREEHATLPQYTQHRIEPRMLCCAMLCYAMLCHARIAMPACPHDAHSCAMLSFHRATSGLSSEVGQST